MIQRPRSMSVLEATQQAPALARLSELAQESKDRLVLLEPLIPVNLHASLRPGPIDKDQWCLIVANNSSAAKMRQLLPGLAAHLRSKGREVNSIRLRIQMRQD
jgi:hypothetical protein